MKKALAYIVLFLRWIWHIVTAPFRKATMNKVVTYALIIGVVSFIVFWGFFMEISVIPVGILTSIVMVTLRYAIDRWGFAKIDTIKMLQTEASNERPQAYIAIMWQYTVLVLGAFAFSYLALGS